MPRIFINYRVRDQAGYAALLDRVLTERFGPETVFRDFRSVRPGDDFVQEIFSSLRSSTALLAVIGPGWGAGVRPAEHGGYGDWVHREIAEAFALGVRVIPVLVEDADLPREGDLPPDIAALSRCQAVRIRHSNIDDDLERIVDAVGRLLPDRRRAVPAKPGNYQPERLAFDDQVRLFRMTGTDCRIGVVSGSIRRVRFADVWVNPENTEMEMPRVTEFSISAIIRYDGARLDQAGRVAEDLIADELAAAVGPRRPVAPGTAIVTGAGRLTETHNVHFVIHVAGVQGEPGAGFRQVRSIGDCVTNALDQADRLTRSGHQASTVLIPVLGVGMGGGAVEPTVRQLLGATLDYLTATPDTALHTVYFLAYAETEHAAFTNAIATNRRLSSTDPLPQPR
jgi:O-acetyl-ADP-ribose deacetylase (regulator of RNase III)